MPSTPPNIPFTPLPSSPNNSTCSVHLMQAGSLRLPRSTILLPSPNTPQSSPSSPPEQLHFPVYVFLLTHHPSKTQYLFDLGIATPSSSSSSSRQPFTPRTHRRITSPGWSIAPLSPTSILHAHAPPGTTENIKAVLFSHLHFDHAGDVARSGGLENAELWLGPITTSWARPGYPVDAESTLFEADLPRDGSRVIRELRVPERVLEEAGDGRVGIVQRAVEGGRYEGVELWEPEGGWTRVGSFPRAADVFGDGSLWVVDAPGHCVGHVMGLVRVKIGGEGEGEDDWVLLAGDCFHHVDLLREPEKMARKPYAEEGMHADPVVAMESIWRTRRMAVERNVWVVQAHDPSVARALGVEDHEKDGGVKGLVRLDDWREKGWKGKQGKF